MSSKTSIVELNKDVEKYVLQAGRRRSPQRFAKFYGDTAKPLCFVDASDMHDDPDMWSRMSEYINHYQDYISFGLHTGDYCGGNQGKYTDFYAECTPCVKPIYNCPGNHDCVGADDNWRQPAPKESVYKLLYNHTENWDVTFMDCEHSMSYYKDFEESDIRLIVLDLYYDVWTARLWLYEILDDALKKGLHVVTAMHEPTDYVEDTFGALFCTKDDYNAVNRNRELHRKDGAIDHRGRVLFEDVIADFIGRGGNYVCNLAGHNHHDEFGLTHRGILNVVIENGTSWDTNGDSSRFEGTKSYDCFNVVAIDTDIGLLKLIRIGSNVDHYLREKNVLCFDYKNKEIIFQK